MKTNPAGPAPATGLLASETEWLVLRAALAGGVLAAGMGLAQWVLGGRGDFWVATSAAVLCVVLALIWRKVGSSARLLHVAVGLYTALFGAGMVFGSLDYIAWEGLVVLVAMVVLGRRAGTLWALIIVGVIGLAVAARALGLSQPGADPLPVRGLRLGSLVVTLAAIAAVFEEQRRRNIEDLERAMAARSRLLAQVSHEMRTPLNGIIGATQALRLDAAQQSRDVREGLDTIEHSGQALLTLINDLLEFARAEAGKTEFEHRPFDVRAMVERTIAAYRARATAAGCTLSAELPPRPVGALGDAVRLQQVLGNLLSNAVRHGGAGPVRVRLEASDAPDAHVALALSVRDEGPGLDAEQRARLFEPFVQLNPRTASGGSGLGLHISRAIARELGGELTLDSAPGDGCTFTLRVRLPHAEPEPGRAAELPALHGRVLVVDDNPINLKVAAALLTRLGLTVDPVDSGQAALTRADEPVDLVLMDVQMPGLDGLETTRRLRAAGFNAPIVALTASALPDTEAECASAGMSGYLVKPLRLERLVPELEKWLPGVTAEGRSRG